MNTGAQKPSDEIPNIHFVPGDVNPIEFDILRLDDLYSEKEPALESIHRIHFFSMIFIKNGRGNHMIDFRDVKYQPRDILFIADKQVHQFRVHSDTKGYITPFTQEFLYHNESDQNILQNYRLFDYSLNSPKISLSQESFNRLEWLFDELFSEHDRSAKSELQSEITRSLLKTILLTAEREKRKMFSHAEHNLNYPDFVKFKSSLERNFCFTRNVSDYSRMLGISSQKLNQLTKKILNQTAKTFIDERVIIEAKRLLAHTNLSAKEISEAVGFDEPTNFNKYFKRHTKQTPRSFRQIQKS